MTPDPQPGSVPKTPITRINSIIVNMDSRTMRWRVGQKVLGGKAEITRIFIDQYWQLYHDENLVMVFIKMDNKERDEPWKIYALNKVTEIEQKL